VQARELDREANLRRYVRGLIADMRNLGFTTGEMRGKSIVELEELRARALLRLMAAPGSEKAS
jgi:hypothetical protein